MINVLNHEEDEKMTKVVNLCTGEEIYFDAIPAHAVIKAHLYSIGNRNTWEWDQRIKDMMINLNFGKKTVSYNDWCALLEKPA